MVEVLFWSAAVFAVLGVLPLVAAWRELRRERKEAEQRSQRRQSEESHREKDAPENGALRFSSSTGVAGDLRRFLASLTCRPRMTGNDFAVRVDYASWGVRTVSIRRRAMRRPAMVVMVTR